MRFSLLFALLIAMLATPAAFADSVWVFVGTYTGKNSKGIYRVELVAERGEDVCIEDLFGYAPEGPCSMLGLGLNINENSNRLHKDCAMQALSQIRQIDYTVVNLTSPFRTNFKYRLEGFDNGWIDAGTRRQAFYNDLLLRNYRFRVIAANNSGVWNETGAFLDFSVDPAYYQTWWFLVSCVAAFPAFFGVLYRLRLRQVARQFNIRMEEIGRAHV